MIKKLQHLELYKNQDHHFFSFKAISFREKECYKVITLMYIIYGRDKYRKQR